MIRGKAAALLLFAALPCAVVAADRAGFDRHCASCHAVAADAPSGPGPNLAGVVGRRLAGDPAFDYSPALRAARGEGQVWDTGLLDRFLTDPDALVPGTWMGANVVRAAEERRAVIEFLGSTP